MLRIKCPHCGKHEVLGDLRDWWDGHVIACATKLAERVADGWIPEKIHLVGSVLLELLDPEGRRKDVRAVGNIITTAGKGLVAARLVNASIAVADYQAVGTGTGDEAAGDTTLGTEVARVQGTISVYNSVTSRLVTTFAAGTGTGALTETGRLNAASVGTLLCRKKFDVVNKASGDSLSVTHDVTVS